jgi:hypothetical protein
MSRGKTNKNFICKICNMSMNANFCGRHLKNKHDITLKEYKIKYEGYKNKERKCLVCKCDISHLHTNVKICSDECRYQHKINKSIEKYKNTENHIICKICGMIFPLGIISHLHRVHNISVDEYKLKYDVDINGIMSKSTREKLSEYNKGDKNPAYQHGGKFSPFSKKFIKYENLSENETNILIDKVVEKAKNNRTHYNTRLNYWLDITNGDKDEAELLFKNRQATFSLDTCICKYGEDGYNIWIERQEKWQKTLQNKTKEEIDIINSKKSPSLKNFIRKWGKDEGKRKYLEFKNKNKILKASIESLKIFLPLKKWLELKGIYDIKFGVDNNHEYYLYDGKKTYWYDFTIPSLKVMIEYHGEVFHPNPFFLSEKEWIFWTSAFGDSADTIAEKDILKRNLAKNTGFKLLEIWSIDKNKLQICKNFIEEVINGKIC